MTIEENRPLFPDLTHSPKDSLFSNQEDDLFADFRPSQTQSDQNLFAESVVSETPTEENIFAEAEKPIASVKLSTNQWKVLIVDDEKDIHEITTLVLGNYTYKNKPLEIMNAYSAEQAKVILNEHQDIAVVFLDVVMESHDAGLQLVRYIRDQLSNPFMRIVLRTGQPGYAPEEKIILEYEISDYANKTELSRQKLITITTASLRSYADIMTVESYRQSLEEKVRQRTQELEEKNQELTLLNDKLVALNIEKNEFLGIAAHDLKNPLAAIFGLANEITTSFNEYSKEEIIEDAKMIQLASEQMFSLITNLLDVNAIESGKINIVCKTVDILPVIQDLIEFYTKRALSKEIVIHFQPPESECTAYVDKDTTRQVLDNLISNAIKYSPPNTQVHLQVDRQDEWVHCVIRDQGQGLKPEEQALLFRKFTRLSPRPTAGEHSTGLGLFIVKKLTDALGGQIWCESQLGKGSQFTVTFPTVEKSRNRVPESG